MDNQDEIITTPSSIVAKKDSKTAVGGIPSPTETINFCLEMTKTIVSGHGTATPVSKDEISKELKKAVGTLIMKISSCSQYGILNNVHGKGYQASELYQKYSQPVYPNDELIAKLKMFQNPPLYAKLIENLNNQILPSEDKFVNLLKGEQYRLNPNSAERAAKIFFENCRSLNLIDSSGRFKFSITNTTTINNNNESKVEDISQQDISTKGEKPLTEGLIRLPIHLPGENNRVAYFDYPKTLNKRDFKIIAKALTFVASSLITDESDEDYELKIEVKEIKGNE